MVIVGAELLATELAGELAIGRPGQALPLSGSTLLFPDHPDVRHKIQKQL
jgi:hypothetical protein